jgi:hypothetical protein
MLSFKKSPSIRDWFDILNWSGLPNLGSCHTNMTSETFKKNYYINDDISTLYNNLTTTLEFNGLESQNIRILGHPGAGKTSFLYAMKHISEGDDPVLKNYYFYIYHINKSDNLQDEETYESEIDKHIVLAWKGFFNANGFMDEFIRIEAQELSLKQKMNLATDFYRENKKKFSKIMIFAVDDVDLLPGEDVLRVVNHILRSIEVNSVKKWLSIRRVSLENYNRETKSRVEEFFPDFFDFPKISLYDLVNYRISNSFSDNYKNPFSKLLCDETISPICEGNMREGLALVKSLLENVFPKNFAKHTSEKVIQEYVSKSAVDTLCRSQKLIDLHSMTFKICPFPLAIDILACIRHHAHEPVIYGSVTDCCTKRDYLSGDLLGEEERHAKVRSQDFNMVIKKLIEHKLIINTSKGYYQLTDKGKLLSSFSTRDFYFNFHKENNKVIIDDELYWSLSSHKLSYSDIVSNYLTVRK